MYLYPNGYPSYQGKVEKVTTTKEYDTEGRLVRETVVTETTYPANYGGVVTSTINGNDYITSYNNVVDNDRYKQ